MQAFNVSLLAIKLKLNIIACGPEIIWLFTGAWEKWFNFYPYHPLPKDIGSNAVMFSSVCMQFPSRANLHTMYAIGSYTYAWSMVIRRHWNWPTSITFEQSYPSDLVTKPKNRYSLSLNYTSYPTILDLIYRISCWETSVHSGRNKVSEHTGCTRPLWEIKRNAMWYLEIICSTINICALHNYASDPCRLLMTTRCLKLKIKESCELVTRYQLL